MVLVHFNRLCVSGPCLYMKIMSDREGREAGRLRGASEGFRCPNRDPVAGQPLRTQARQLGLYMLKSGLLCTKEDTAATGYKLWRLPASAPTPQEG